MLNRSRNRKHNTQHTGEDEQNPGGRTRGYATRRGSLDSYLGGGPEFVNSGGNVESSSTHVILLFLWASIAKLELEK